MSRPDATASAALSGDIKPVFFAYLDILGDPLRVNTSGHDLTLTGTGFPDMDGFLFAGIDSSIMDVSPVKFGAGGSDTVTATLSGIIGLDQDVLDQISNPVNWRGRTARLWRMIRDANGTQQGAIQHYYAGYMMAMPMGGDPSSQTVSVQIESYLAAFSAASNRTYLDQESFDPGDLSARAAIAIANGNSGNPLTNNTPTPSANFEAIRNGFRGILGSW